MKFVFSHSNDLSNGSDTEFLANIERLLYLLDLPAARRVFAVLVFGLCCVASYLNVPLIERLGAWGLIAVLALIMRNPDQNSWLPKVLESIGDLFGRRPKE